jgi:DNA repair protein RadA/Sms
MRVTEPATDLAIALAIGSAVKNQPIPHNTVAIGEVGLAGEVRRVTAVARRVAEAKRLGFAHAIIPAGTDEKLPSGIRITRVDNLAQAIAAKRKRDVVDAPF